MHSKGSKRQGELGEHICWPRCESGPLKQHRSFAADEAFIAQADTPKHRNRTDKLLGIKCPGSPDRGAPRGPGRPGETPSADP